jgi:hypothetical protein
MRWLGAVSINVLPVCGRPTLAGLAGVTLALAVCGGAEASTGPLLTSDSVAGSGAALGSMGPAGVTIRFIDRGRFSVGVLLRNGSNKTVTVINAQTPEPPRSLVHQVGTRLAPFAPCAGDRFCSLLPSGADAARLRPVTLAPGAEVGVQLNYQLGACKDVPLGSLATAHLLDVRYEYRHGSSRQQTIPLGRGRLFLQKPAGVECVPRPYSHIGLVGSFTTSPGHKPVPGSDGDTCTKSATGKLLFRSRLFTDRSGIQFRVEIALPHFVGRGVYATSRTRARRGLATVIVSGGFGIRSQTSFHGNPSVVTVRKAAGSLFGGRFTATLSGRRRFFRAYGAWRCTTKLR